MIFAVLMCLRETRGLLDGQSNTRPVGERCIVFAGSGRVSRPKAQSPKPKAQSPEPETGDRVEPPISCRDHGVVFRLGDDEACRGGAGTLRRSAREARDVRAQDSSGNEGVRLWR